MSSQIFLPYRLDTAMLDALRDGGARAIELWAARWHVDYTDRGQMRELGRWFGANEVGCTLHAPLTTDTSFSRHASPTVNLVDGDRGRRIWAMDEVKRALEMAENLPVRTCVLHLGSNGGGRGDKWSEYVLEYCLTAVEHLKAFAGPLGVKLLLENLPNEVATPEHLLEVLRVGHFDGCGVCLDTGHAHGSDAGLPAALELLRARITEVHVNDNSGPAPGGGADEHMWPASGAERPGYAARGTMDWAAAYGLLAGLPEETVGMLEVADKWAGAGPAEVERLLREVLAHERRLREERMKVAEEGASRG